MSLNRFIRSAASGDALGNGLLMAGDYLLRSDYDRAADYLDTVASIVLAIVVSTYLGRALPRRGH